MHFILIAICCAIVFSIPNYHSYDKYLLEIGRNLTKTSNPGEYMARKEIYQMRVKKMLMNNANPSKTWKLSLNKFSDWTKDELKGMRGLKLAHKKFRNFVPVAVDPNFDVDAPINIDWRTKGVVTDVKNQGSCGSCWSFGTAETLESYWALAGNPLTVLSEQQILDCTPNPNGCGGTGGCEGGTVELAYARIIVMGGLSTEQSYPYQGTDESCQQSQVVPVANMSSYVNLPSNVLAPMLAHIANNGPIAISVDASSWSDYGGGVYDGCDQSNPDLDHAVQLVGAGTDPSLGDYWLVRNSWGADWGESGYIRLRRTSTLRCGTDTSPQDGDGCNGGPTTVQVCGTCGILYDGVYPVVSK